MKTVFCCLLLAASCLCATTVNCQTPPLPLQDYLNDGRAALAAQIHEDALGQKPTDDNLRFQTAVAQSLAGMEALAQTWYKYGLRTALGPAPFLRMPLPRNPSPEPVTYEDTHAALGQLQSSLDNAARTLSSIKDSSGMKVPLELRGIRLRVATTAGNPDSDFIRFWDVFQRLARPGAVPSLQPAQVIVHFDVGDARWLEGYCHLLSGMIDMWLAYDTRELFNHSAHLYFTAPVTPYPFLKDSPAAGAGFDLTNIIDAMAAVHEIRFKLEEPQRMESARRHLLQVIDLSRRSWSDILAETDNDHEWIPNPRQDGALPGFRVTPEMVQTWNQFLNESESMLTGKTLAPFWRNAPVNGVNLSKVFTQPSDFDLVLWLQGTGVLPYLEEGPITDKKFWSAFNQAFHGDLLLYGLWFN